MRPLILVLALVAADDRYGFTDESLTQAAFTSVTSGFYIPTPTKELKALSVEARATAVTVLGKAVRGVVETASFKERYRDYVKRQRPKAPEPKRSHEQVLAEVKKQMDEQRAASEKGLAQLDPAQRKQVQASMDQAYEANLQLYKDKNMVDLMETQRFASEQTSYAEAAKRYPDDPNVKLKQMLAAFVADTEGVDFSAKTVAAGGKQKFANAAYERKNDLWKAAYRAGKPATEAARAFAREWIAALGK